MRKKVILAILALTSCVIFFSCSYSKRETDEPYFIGDETPIHSIPSKYTFYEPEWPEDEDGDYIIPIEILVDSVDYLTLQSKQDFNQLADSLVYVYNLITLCNAFDTDVLTYSRELTDPTQINPSELNWIKEGELRDLFKKLDRAVCNIVYKDDFDEYNQATADVKEYINEKYLQTIYAKVDTTELAKAFAPTTYVADIDSLHNMIFTKPNESSQRIKDRILNEKYFIPQAYLAEKYALSCYAHPDSTVGGREQFTGLLEDIMRANLYSPNLTTIWRMWRVRNQMYHSPSNDGPIYNHYYNVYRNRIATTYLEYYVSTGDSAALQNFLDLATEPNIIRQGTFIGNYATLEDMDLFWGPTRAKD